MVENGPKKISKLAKFKSDMSDASGNIALQKYREVCVIFCEQALYLGIR